MFETSLVDDCTDHGRIQRPDQIVDFVNERIPLNCVRLKPSECATLPTNVAFVQDDLIVTKVSELQIGNGLLNNTGIGGLFYDHEDENEHREIRPISRDYR